MLNLDPGTVTAIATAVLAVVTAVYVILTYWLVRQQRRAPQDEAARQLVLGLAEKQITLGGIQLSFPMAVDIMGDEAFQSIDTRPLYDLAHLIGPRESLLAVELREEAKETADLVWIAANVLERLKWDSSIERRRSESEGRDWELAQVRESYESSYIRSHPLSELDQVLSGNLAWSTIDKIIALRRTLEDYLRSI